MKLRELTLSYDVPRTMLSRLWGRASAASLTLSGRNLLTVTDYTGLDPEVSNFGNQNIARNIDVAPFPPSRSFWFGVELVF
jgi:TonB-dependent starch-binding outer membrane protein SusC